MQTGITKNLLEKVVLLSLDEQAMLLERVETLLEENKIPMKTIWDKLDERLSQVPAEELDELPTDASENLEYYLYGARKK